MATSCASGDASAASARPAGVEHRDVPVALVAVQLDRDRAGSGHVDAARRDAGAARPVRAVAGGRVRARRSGERAVEHRLRARTGSARGERGRAGCKERGEREREGDGGAEAKGHGGVNARTSRSGGDFGAAARGDAPARLPRDRRGSSSTGRRCASSRRWRSGTRRRCAAALGGPPPDGAGRRRRRVGSPVRRGRAVDGDEHPPALVRAHLVAVELRVGPGRRGVVRVQPARHVVGRVVGAVDGRAHGAWTGCASWCGMPAGTEGLLTSGGSMASLTALVAAREARGGGRRRVHVATRRTARSCGT